MDPMVAGCFAQEPKNATHENRQSSPVSSQSVLAGLRVMTMRGVRRIRARGLDGFGTGAGLLVPHRECECARARVSVCRPAWDGL